jgi:hypothetical protein
MHGLVDATSCVGTLRPSNLEQRFVDDHLGCTIMCHKIFDAWGGRRSPLLHCLSRINGRTNTFSLRISWPLARSSQTHSDSAFSSRLMSG